MKRKTLLIALSTFSQIHSVQASWFADTPLQPVYQALVNHQPQLAWQELILAMSNNNIDSQYWLPAKQEILKQTSCGQELFDHDESLPADISVTFIRRSGLSSQGFQIKLSAESVSAPSNVKLISPSKSVLLEGLLARQKSYQEIESKEILVEPRSGIYQLKTGESTYRLVISQPSNQNWLKLDNTIQQLTVNLPLETAGCTNPIAAWQWFDSQYNLLGRRIPITQSTTPIPTSKHKPQGAKNLSATASIFEYQQNVKIEYIQRIAIPLTP
ncbi:DUF2861 family protein [Vibrio aquimaris]|jgi:hypothetical protein|uniref:DUF2861 domain-containing protein n=1 Tax=Vibrio aquimaris TaxID=2587862 RepID=A0A5P9CPC3_9VIBR|nr:DUF2861 family protein [Vibrio aquimaris]QFT28054.1 hypothetical protein FIV01_16820 [Vibrio aquimaris]